MVSSQKKITNSLQKRSLIHSESAKNDSHTNAREMEALMSNWLTGRSIPAVHQECSSSTMNASRHSGQITSYSQNHHGTRWNSGESARQGVWHTGWTCVPQFYSIRQHQGRNTPTRKDGYGNHPIQQYFTASQ